MTLLRSATPTAGTSECASGHVHAAGCGRHHVLTGLAALGAGALLGTRKSAAQTPAPEKPRLERSRIPRTD